MAYYTLRVQDYIEDVIFPVAPKNLRHAEKIEIGRSFVFDFDYPIFDEGYRRDFETMILRSFYMNEINDETPELWKFKLETWLNLHMPYYNQLYLSTLIEYDPLINTDYKVTSLGKKNVKFDEKGNTSVATTVDKTGSKKFAEDQEGNTTNDGTSNTSTKNNLDSENNVKGNVNTDTKNDGTNDIIKDGTVTDVEEKIGSDKGNKDQKTFDRKIETDTPDSRLQITTNDDGTGVIEYASKIDEDKKNFREDHDVSTKENNKNDRTSNENSKATTSDTGNTKTDATSDTIHKENATGNADTTAHNEEKSTKNTIQNTTTTDGTKSNVTGGSDKNNTTDEVKDYIESRVGKQGVETYSEMVMKFRKAMINVDEQVIRAMRKELFMIVY